MKCVMVWGYYSQGSPEILKIDELGKKLSVEIECPVHYPAFGKRLFECKCGVIFPAYVVDGGNWEAIKKKHREKGI